MQKVLQHGHVEIVFKHIKYDVQNFIILQTLEICTGEFCMKKISVLASSLVMALSLIRNVLHT